MKVPFDITVILFMILSGVMLIMLSFGMTSKVKEKKWFKPALWIASSCLFLFLLLISIFVVEW